MGHTMWVDPYGCLCTYHPLISLQFFHLDIPTYAATSTIQSSCLLTSALSQTNPSRKVKHSWSLSSFHASDPPSTSTSTETQTTTTSSSSIQKTDLLRRAIGFGQMLGTAFKYTPFTQFNQFGSMTNVSHSTNSISRLIAHHDHATLAG